MNLLGSDPLSLSAEMLAQGVSTLIVTLGRRGAVYVTDGRTVGTVRTERSDRTVRLASPSDGAVRTALVAGEIVEALDPTGCGDVFGGAVFSRLLAGESVEAAVASGNRAAARNVGFRGASGLASHLRGELVAP
jgi:sugar/nucleoside kinase (ribokinase family)